MAKDDWCSPTREVSKPTLLELAHRSVKVTENLEVEMLIERRRRRTSDIVLLDRATGNCAALENAWFGDTVPRERSEPAIIVSEPPPREPLALGELPEQPAHVARELAQAAAAREAAARRRRGSYAGTPVAEKPRRRSRWAFQLVLWLLLLATIGVAAAHFTHFARFTI
jgi:hypothetical protein